MLRKNKKRRTNLSKGKTVPVKDSVNRNPNHWVNSTVIFFYRTDRSVKSISGWSSEFNHQKVCYWCAREFPSNRVLRFCREQRQWHHSIPKPMMQHPPSRLYPRILLLIPGHGGDPIIFFHRKSWQTLKIIPLPCGIGKRKTVHYGRGILAYREGKDEFGNDSKIPSLTRMLWISLIWTGWIFSGSTWSEAWNLRQWMAW